MKRKRAHALGDFTTDWRMIQISALAIFIGFITTLVAWALLRLIGLVTNLLYYHRWSSAWFRRRGISLVHGPFWCRWPERWSSE